MDEVENGTRTQRNYSEGCNASSETAVYCHYGATLTDGACVIPPPQCSIYNLEQCKTELSCKEGNGFWYAGNSSCPTGQIVTERGCEYPVSSCPLHQEVQNNQCVGIPYIEASGTLCGTYKDPIRIVKGTHVVSCPTHFKERLYIEKGVTLLVDDSWDITADNVISIEGSVDQPVSIKASANNPSGGMGRLLLASKESPSLYNKALGGYVTFFNVTNSKNMIILKLLNLKHSNFYTDAGFEIREINSQSSTFSSSSGGTYTHEIYYSLFVNSQFDSGRTIYSEGGVFISSEFINTNIHAYAGRVRFPYSAFFYGRADSTELKVTCYDKETFIQGHKNKTVVNYCKNESDNDGTEISDKLTVYITESESRVASINQPFKVEAMIFDKNGVVFTDDVVWKARYSVDGEYFDSGQSWIGREVEITLPITEYYDVYIESVNGQSYLLGPNLINVMVD